jgi:hypothetical protein
MDLSPLTPYYTTPSMKLYSAVEVLSALRHTDKLIKIDLTSGFYQLQLQDQHAKFYGIYYRGISYTFTILRMGPSIFRRLAQAVAAILNSKFDVSMVAYLDDWLIFGSGVPSDQIQQEFASLGITINRAKSTLHPTSALIYLGLRIDAVHQTFQPTATCINHMQELVALVPTASSQDLRRIVGYVLWLCWAMNWPTFIATHLYHRSTYWCRWFLTNRLFQRPRQMTQPRRSAQLYTDATPTSIGLHLHHLARNIRNSSRQFRLRRPRWPQPYMDY